MAQGSPSKRERTKSPAEVAADDVQRARAAERVKYGQMLFQAALSLLVAFSIWMLTGVRDGQKDAENERKGFAIGLASLKSDLQLVVQQQKNDRDTYLAAVESLRVSMVENQRRQDLQIAEMKSQQAQFENRFTALQTDITVLKTILSPTSQPTATKAR